mmetsp:Transcript_22317/g.55289  ORF Transcript_22317/g.55289 Transcript_22317/m.55289 type:complete len:359 (-) Transcript_22317:2515-3591(-)
MDSRAAFPGGASSSSSGNGLVVTKLLVTKGEIIHATLAGCTCRKCLKDNVHNSLGSEDVAPNDTGVRRGIQQRAFRNDKGNRSQASLIQRNRLGTQRAERINDGAIRDCWRCVVVGKHLWPRSRKVKGGISRLWIDFDAELNGRPIVHVVHSRNLGAIFRTEILQHETDGGLSILLDEIHVGLDNVQPIFFDQFLQETDSRIVRRNLSAEITDVVPEISCTRVSGNLTRSIEDFRHSFFLELSILDNLKCNNHGSFVDKRLRMRRHRTGGNSSNVGVVTTAGYKEYYFTLVEHRSDCRDIWQMGSSGNLGVIGYKDVTFFDSSLVCPVLDLVSDSCCHCPEMHGNVWSIGNQSTVLCE